MKAFAVVRDDSPTIRMIQAEETSHRFDEAVVTVDAFSLDRGEMFRLGLEGAGRRPGKDISGSLVAACTDGSGPAMGTRVVAHLDAAGRAELVAVATDRPEAAVANGHWDSYVSTTFSTVNGKSRSRKDVR
jgi:hypothetical protein